MEKDYKWQQRVASRNKKNLESHLTSLDFFEGQFNGGFSQVFSRFWDSPPLGFHGTSHVGQAVRFNTAEALGSSKWLDDVNQQIYGICFINVLCFFCDILWISMINMMELFDDTIYIYTQYTHRYGHSLDMELHHVHWTDADPLVATWNGGLVPWVCQRCGRRSGDWVHPAEWSLKLCWHRYAHISYGICTNIYLSI